MLFHDPAQQWECLDPGREFLLGRVALSPPPQDYLVFIGAGFAHGALRAALEASLASPSPTPGGLP